MNDILKNVMLSLAFVAIIGIGIAISLIIEMSVRAGVLGSVFAFVIAFTILKSCLMENNPTPPDIYHT